MTAIVVPRFRCGDDYRKSESPLGKPEGSISIRMFVVLGQQHEHTTTAGNPQVERADFGPCRFDDRSRFKCQMIFARGATTNLCVFIGMCPGSRETLGFACHTNSKALLHLCWPKPFWLRNREERSPTAGTGTSTPIAGATAARPTRTPLCCRRSRH